MGYNVYVYAFYGVNIPRDILIKYFINAYQKEIKHEGFTFNPEVYIFQVLGIEKAFHDHFGYELTSSCRDYENETKYYLVLGDRNLIYVYNTDSKTRANLPYDFDLSLLSKPFSCDKMQTKIIMEKLAISKFKISPWVICNQCL